MSNKVDTLKQFIFETEGLPLIEVKDCIWLETEYDITWNTEDNLIDLYNGEEETYSGEILCGASLEWEGYKVVNLDTGCGAQVTYLFPLDKEIKSDELQQ